MAHDLAVINGKHAMFVVGKREDAWHKLGQRCDSAVSWERAMQLAGLDWQVARIKTTHGIRKGMSYRSPVTPSSGTSTGLNWQAM